jgi:hypothetical protein
VPKLSGSSYSIDYYGLASFYGSRPADHGCFAVEPVFVVSAGFTANDVLDYPAATRVVRFIALTCCLHLET